MHLWLCRLPQPHASVVRGAPGAELEACSSLEPMSQQGGLSSERPTGAGQNGQLKIYKTRESTFGARKRSHEAGDQFRSI